MLTDGGKTQVSGENPEKRAEIPYGLADSLRKPIVEIGAMAR